MDTNSYIAFLVLGAILVAIDGQIIYRSGRRYLEHSYGDPESGKSMTRLVTVLFHLAVLGVLMLISTVDVGGDNQTEGVITRLGIVLLLLAVAHGLTVVILARVRDRQMQERLAEEMNGTAPVRHEQTPEPTIEPRLEPRPPYQTP